MLKIFDLPHVFIYSVKPFSKYIFSCEVYSEGDQANNSTIVTVDFIGLDNSNILSKDIGLCKSENEGFWFYLSSYDEKNKLVKQEFNIPRGCYAVRISIKRWNANSNMSIVTLPSIEQYDSKHASSSFKEKIKNRIDKNEGYERHKVLSFVDHKLNAYEFARGLNLQVPKILGVWESLDDITELPVNHSFVLKPLFAHSNKGVMVLERIETDLFYEKMRGLKINFVEVKEILSNEVKDFGSNTFFIEDLICDAHETAIPIDYRVYSFYGHVGLIMQRTLNKSDSAKDWRFKFYDRNWNDLGKIKFPDRIDPTLPLPVYNKEIVEYAEKLSRNIEVPFIRVDIYDTDNGPMLGELTPTPGGYDGYSHEIDQLLGNLWNEAELRLNVK